MPLPYAYAMPMTPQQQQQQQWGYPPWFVQQQQQPPVTPFQPPRTLETPPSLAIMKRDLIGLKAAQVTDPTNAERSRQIALLEEDIRKKGEKRQRY